VGAVDIAETEAFCAPRKALRLIIWSFHSPSLQYSFPFELGIVCDTPEVGTFLTILQAFPRILPFIGLSAVIGTMIGALPGIGSTLAATLGYASAVFIILATESIGGFNPGPAVFQLIPDQINSEMVIAFGLFTTMIFANLLNWTIGGVFMRWMGIIIKIPKQRLLPIVFLLTLTAIYVQQTSMFAVIVTLCFGLLGYLMRKFKISPIPFVIAYILANNLEEALRQAFAVTGSDPWFLFSSPICIVFMVLAIIVVIFFARNQKEI
jgi:putative tricarboxylic transport membrane protein